MNSHPKLASAAAISDSLLQMSNENGSCCEATRANSEFERPDDMAIGYMLGTALVRDNRVAEGERLDRILRAGDSAESQFLMGTAKFGIGRFAEALKEFQKAVELNPKLPAAHGYLWTSAPCHRRHGREPRSHSRMSSSRTRMTSKQISISRCC